MVVVVQVDVGMLAADFCVLNARPSPKLCAS